jgi:hypothetical protein
MAGLRGQDRHQTFGQNRYSQEIQFALTDNRKPSGNLSRQ